MNSQNKDSLKLRIHFEFAYEIITISLIVIFVGLSFLFASNLLALNWFSVIFGLLAIGLLYLKLTSSLEIKNDLLTLIYLKGFRKQEIEIITIDEFVFYEDVRLVEVKSNHQVIADIYLTEKNKQKMLNYIVNEYPKIPCIILKKNTLNG